MKSTGCITTLRIETGCIRFNAGVMSSYGSAWTLDVHSGVSRTAPTPHKGLDAIREATRIIDYMDYIVAKKTDPFSPLFSAVV